MFLHSDCSRFRFALSSRLRTVPTTSHSGSISRMPLFLLMGLAVVVSIGLFGVVRWKQNASSAQNVAGTLSLAKLQSGSNLPKALNGAKAQAVFEKFGVKPYFTPKCIEFLEKNENSSKKNRNSSEKNKKETNSLPYTDAYRTKHLKNGEAALTWDEVEALKFGTTVMVYNSRNAKHVAGRSTAETGKILDGELNGFLRENGYQNISPDMRGILELSAASAWTIRNTHYLLYPSPGADVMVNAQDLLNKSEPPVVCADAAVIARDISRGMSALSGSEMNTYYVSGSYLDPSEPEWDGQKRLGHAWILGVLSSGMKMPTDPTPSSRDSKSQMDWSKPHKTYHHCPTDEVGFELNLASYCPSNHTASWAKMKAFGAKPRRGLELQQGDPQIHALNGMNTGKSSNFWENWLIKGQPYREGLRGVEEWYTNRFNRR